MYEEHEEEIYLFIYVSFILILKQPDNEVTLGCPI